MIEQDLDELALYGQPSLSQLIINSNVKWWCRIEMRVNTKSVTFKVEGDAPTAAQATALCLKNMHQAIADINGNKMTQAQIGVAK